MHSQEYADWYGREVQYTKDHAKNELAEDFADAWMPSDIAQIKGLAMMEDGSLAWKKATPEMQCAVREYLKTNKVPTIGKEWPREKTSEEFEVAKRRMIAEFNAKMKTETTYDIMGRGK
jgi:hypothetical protein